MEFMGELLDGLNFAHATGQPTCILVLLVHKTPSILHLVFTIKTLDYKFHINAYHFLKLQLGVGTAF